MTRYSMLYYEALEKGKKQSSEGAALRAEAEHYRRFIRETGKVREFMLWVADDIGLCDCTKKILAEADYSEMEGQRLR